MYRVSHPRQLPLLCPPFSLRPRRLLSPQRGNASSSHTLGISELQWLPQTCVIQTATGGKLQTLERGRGRLGISRGSELLQKVGRDGSRREGRERGRTGGGIMIACCYVNDAMSRLWAAWASVAGWNGGPPRPPIAQFGTYTTTKPQGTSQVSYQVVYLLPPAEPTASSSGLLHVASVHAADLRVPHAELLRRCRPSLHV